MVYVIMKNVCNGNLLNIWKRYVRYFNFEIVFMYFVLFYFNKYDFRLDVLNIENSIYVFYYKKFDWIVVELRDDLFWWSNRV